jgi:hypothetical protein
MKLLKDPDHTRVASQLPLPPQNYLDSEYIFKEANIIDWKFIK